MSGSDEITLRRAMLVTAQALVSRGLNKGTAGNVGCRLDDGLLLTPSGIPVEQMCPDSMVRLRVDGTVCSLGKPSSEWLMHCDILRSRPDVGAIVHSHPPFATSLACLRQDIPPFHYMIALAGGDNIRCAPYALFGSAELSHLAVSALENRQACLLANHGMIALGGDLDEALAMAIEVENLCEHYWRARQLGEPVLLNAGEMQLVLARFQTYGSRAVPRDSNSSLSVQDE